MKSVIGIGEYGISDNKYDTLKTFALASCVAITAYNPVRRTGAMVHVALPKPSNNEERLSRPCYYATSGIPLMIEKLCSNCGCYKSDLQIQIFGGAESINDKDIFQIGKKNIEAVIETLNKMNLKISKADIGGRVSRTVEFDSNTGAVYITCQPITI